MVEIQKYVPAASALLSLQCDIESYLALTELLSLSLSIDHVSSILPFVPLCF